MGKNHEQFLLLLTFIYLQLGRSVTCRWENSIDLGGRCFMFHRTPLSYFDAKIACQLNGGVLAKLVFKSEMNFIYNTFGMTEIDIWIGASDSQTEGTFLWEDGGDVATLLSELWYIGEPKNNDGSEDCAHIYGYYDDGGMGQNFLGTVASRCTDSYPFVCLEKDVTTIPALTMPTEKSSNLDMTPSAETALYPDLTTTPRPSTTPELITTQGLTTTPGPATFTSKTTDPTTTKIVSTSSTTTTKNATKKCAKDCNQFNYLLCLILCIS